VIFYKLYNESYEVQRLGCFVVGILVSVLLPIVYQNNGVFHTWDKSYCSCAWFNI